MTKEQAFQAINELQAWAYNYPSWLSENTDYARGYKAGIIQAMSIVRQIISAKPNKID